MCFRDGLRAAETALGSALGPYHVPAAQITLWRASRVGDYSVAFASRGRRDWSPCALRRWIRTIGGPTGGPLGRLGYLFPAPRASRRSVFARAIHALPAESAAARYRLEPGPVQALPLKTLEASFAQVCSPLFSCPCHSPLCSLPYPLRFAGSGGQGATRSEQRGLLVVSNRTEFRTSAPRTLMPGQRHSSDGQVMEGDDGLRRRASVIVLGGP
jgi:hypothetical protein